MGRPARQKPDPERGQQSNAAYQEVREPETEKGRVAREQYLSFARASLGDRFALPPEAGRTLSYPALYQRYAGEPSQVQQAAQALDEAVALLALKSGATPRQVVQLLAQGPLTQYQTRDLSPETRKTALPRLLQYAQTIVGAAQRQRFLEYANAVTGEVWNYPDLYRKHIGSDLTAIQLDQKVAAFALQAGESADSVVALLQQSPYSRFQQDVKQVTAETIEQYARGTVAQVQDIQALRPTNNLEQTQGRSRQLDRLL